MKILNNYPAYLLLLILIGMTFAGCIFDSDEDVVWIYKIYEISGRPIEDIDPESTWYYPTEIKLINYLPEKIINGSVKFKQFGWLPIEEEKKGPHEFLVRFPADIPMTIPVDYHKFYNLDISEYFLNGSWTLIAPLAEFGSPSFKAVRELNEIN